MLEENVKSVDWLSPVIYCYNCEHCQHRCSQVLEYGQVYCTKKKVVRNEFDTCGNAERRNENVQVQGKRPEKKNDRYLKTYDSKIQFIKHYRIILPVG